MCSVKSAILVLFAGALAQSQYCNFTPEHTLCKHQGLGAACGDEVPTQQVTSTEGKFIVAEHNRLRAKIATGQETRGKGGVSQPPASNMRQLVWDEELARVAQGHAEQCVFAHDCRDCRRVERFSVGQNLFTSSSTRRQDPSEWKRAIYAWYDEVALFNASHVQPFVFSSPVGHYTQMVWATTTHIGCGYTFYRDGPWWTKLYTCNYGAGGNFINGQMYRRGSSCSSCPAGTSCSTEYPGLCVEDTIQPQPTSSNQTTTTTVTTTTTARTTQPTTTTTARTTQPTTTTSPSTTPSTVVQQLFSCDLDRTGCRVRFSGSNWKVIRSSTSQGRFLGTAVAAGRTSELTYDANVAPPGDGQLCLRFAYLKYALRGGANPDLEVRVLPADGSGPVLRAVEGLAARGEMRRRAVQISDVTEPFRVMFRLSLPAAAFGAVVALAIDDLMLTSGSCSSPVS